MKAVPPIVREIETNLRKQYNEIVTEDSVSMLSNLHKFVNGLSMKSANEQEILKESVRFIYHNFGFKEVAISLRSHADGKFRYEAFLGMTREAEQGYKALAYEYDIVFDDDTYPGIRLGKFIELMPAEMEPYDDGEESTYNRPLMLNTARKTAGDMIEGDYFAIYLFGPGEDIFGWLEMSSTKNGKFPPNRELKGLELFSSVLSLMLSPTRSQAKRTSGQNLRAR